MRRRRNVARADPEASCAALRPRAEPTVERDTSRAEAEPQAEDRSRAEAERRTEAGAEPKPTRGPKTGAEPT